MSYRQRQLMIEAQRLALKVALESYSGHIVGTGGGCEACRVELPGGYDVLITDQEDATITTFGPFNIGLYANAEHNGWSEAVEYASDVTMEQLAAEVACMEEAAKRRATEMVGMVVIPGVVAARVNADGGVIDISFQPHGSSAGYRGLIAELIQAPNEHYALTLDVTNVEGPFWTQVQRVLAENDSKITWEE